MDITSDNIISFPSYSEIVYIDVLMRAALEQNLDLFSLVNDLLCVLRTDYKALTAHDALVADDICLIAGKTNGFDRTVTNTLVTVFTVGFFQSQTFHTVISFLLLFY